MTEYRLHYLDGSRKFIRQDRLSASTDDEAISIAKHWNLKRRSELWRGGAIVAKLSRSRWV